MTLDEVLDAVRGFDGMVELAPEPGSDHPEISWGDHFFYVSPDGRIPLRGQPYATIVTKDYPDEPGSDLDGPDRYRVNIHVTPATYADLLGHEPGDDPGDDPGDRDFTEADRVLPHPVYGPGSWIAVVTPGPRTTATVLELLRAAHDRAAAHAERRRRT